MTCLHFKGKFSIAVDDALGKKLKNSTERSDVDRVREANEELFNRVESIGFVSVTVDDNTHGSPSSNPSDGPVCRYTFSKATAMLRLVNSGNSNSNSSFDPPRWVPLGSVGRHHGDRARYQRLILSRYGQYGASKLVRYRRCQYRIHVRSQMGTRFPVL